MYQVTIEDVAVLLRHCIHRWDNPVIVEGLRRYTSGELRVGWSCDEWTSNAHTNISPLYFGQRVDVVDAHHDVQTASGLVGKDAETVGSCEVCVADGMCYAYFHDARKIRAVAASYLLPASIYALYVAVHT